VHVAQILRNGDAPIPVEALNPMKNANLDQDKVVHKGYVCDGCGVSPIVGVCYKSSVVPDFDFCSKCEATIPHPHPFLKLKTPEQRPHAIFTVIDEEGKTPFNPAKDLFPAMMKMDVNDEHLKKMFKKGKKMFKKMMKGKGHGCPFKAMKEMCKHKKAEKPMTYDQQVEEAIRRSLEETEKKPEKTEEPKETPKEETPKEETPEENFAQGINQVIENVLPMFNQNQQGGQAPNLGNLIQSVGQMLGNPNG